jgi:hypothetical protein
MPKIPRMLSKIVIPRQQKQMRSRRMMAAMTPMTIPAMAPALRPEDFRVAVIGSVLPEAVAGERKPVVVVALTIVDVRPPLVGRRGTDALPIVFVIV